MNKMKIISLIIISILVVTNSFSQNIGYNNLQSFLLRENYQIKNHDNYQNIEGTAFLNKNFSKGDIFTTYGTFKNVDMKYDIYEGTFLLSVDNKTTYLDQLPTVKKIEMDGTDFFIKKYKVNGKDRQSFMIRLDSGQVSLYAKKNVSLRPEEPPKALESASHPARFVGQPDSYFLQMGSGNLVIIESIKDFYEIFPDKAETLKTFVKKEKLGVKKENELIEIVRFCNLNN
jgi:hypothetical protein